MPLTNPSVSNFNFMQLSQVPNKTISDKSFSHLSRSDGSLPAAHLVAVCEVLSSYRVNFHTALFCRIQTLIRQHSTFLVAFYVYGLVSVVWHLVFLGYSNTFSFSAFFSTDNFITYTIYYSTYGSAKCIIS